MTVLLSSRSSLSNFANGRRFYRNFTNSPSSKPGFLPFESVQKLASRRSLSREPSLLALPESISALFAKYDRNRPLPSLKGALHPSEIDHLVSAYPNQSKPNILNMLNIPLPSTTTSLFQSLLSETLASSTSESNNSSSAFIECANVLKKRRRRMRGHKHKKRLKERRHKADK